MGRAGIRLKVSFGEAIDGMIFISSVMCINGSVRVFSISLFCEAGLNQVLALRNFTWAGIPTRRRTCARRSTRGTHRLPSFTVFTDYNAHLAEHSD